MDAKELARRLGPPQEYRIRFHGEDHFLFFHGWWIGSGEHSAEGKTERLRIYLSAVDEFVVTYQCHTGENPAEELGDDIAHLAASHRDLEEALSELVNEGGLNPLVVETIMTRARRDWPLL
jgi:hypothetical protein